VCARDTVRATQREPMDFLFGKKKQQPKQEPGAEMQTAVSKMREHMNAMEKRSAFLQKKIDAETANAKARLQKKDKRGAMMALKKKKLFEKEQDQLSQSTLNLEQQVAMLEQANMSAATVDVMKVGAAAQKQLQKSLNPDVVEDVMDDIQEVQDDMQEVNDILAQPLGGDVMDDADLEAEFEAINEEILDEQLMEISAPGVSVPASADPVVDAPQPAAAAAAPASGEDDELAQLEASMAM